MRDELLFSPVPQVRWKYAKEYPAEEARKLIAERSENWPRYWSGPLNAWLVFLGPSPGNSKANPVNWDVEGLPTLGKPHEHFKTQKDSAGFWNRLRDWTTEAYKLADIFPDDKEAAWGLTLLANVLETQEGDAGKISGEALTEAMPRVVTHLILIKPRIIVPMEKRTAKLLIEELRTRGEIKSITGLPETLVPAKNQRFSWYKPKSWCLETSFGPLLVAESPQHPSKRNFYDEASVDQYLADKIKSCIPGTM